MVSNKNCRPEQLLLLDDPTFLPDAALPPLDFGFDLQDLGDSQRSTQSMMSIRQRSGSVVSSRTGSALGINLPSSSGNSHAYQLPGVDAFGNTPIHKDYEGLGRDLEEEFIEDDNIFAFNEDGELLDLPPTGKDPSPSAALFPSGHRPSDSAASGRVRQEHEDGLAGPLIAGDDDFIMAYGDDDIGILPDAEPFEPMGNNLPLMAGGLGGNDKPQHHSSQDLVLSQEEEEESSSSISAKAPLQRKKFTKKTLGVDKQLSIKSAEFKLWNDEYLKRMAAASLAKKHSRANAQAKKNAFHFVYGSGLNGIGEGIGSIKLASPLEIFAGESLRALLTGKLSDDDDDEGKKGIKRKAGDDPSPPAKRARDFEQGRGVEDQNNNIIIEDDDGLINLDNNDDLLSRSQSVEYGREAGSALPDQPSSALMPWNKSASLHSHQRNASSLQGRAAGSVFGGLQLGGGAGRRDRIASSPLIGRGDVLGGDVDLEQHLAFLEDDAPLYGREDDSGMNFGGAGAGGRSSTQSQSQAHRSNENELGGEADFEMFGQAANVDTQTAGTSQWVRDALDKESNNFFEYVRNSIDELPDNSRHNSPSNNDNNNVDDGEGGVRGGKGKSVTFDELFNVEGNTAVVAAQAFYHVLCLATKRRVWVEQDVGEDESGEKVVPWGEIRIGIVG